MNQKPFTQQQATGSDGKQYTCTVPGDEIQDGVVRNSEQWTTEGSDEVYTRSEKDILEDRFDGATFLYLGEKP